MCLNIVVDRWGNGPGGQRGRGPLKEVPRIFSQIKSHLDRVLRGSVEETLNSLLDAMTIGARAPKFRFLECQL